MSDNAEFYPDHVPEEIKAYCEWHKAAYGWHPFDGIKCFGCGKQVPLIGVYRCYDCRAPFHRDCLVQHCNDDRSVWWKTEASKAIKHTLELTAFLRKIMLLGLLRGSPRLRDEALRILDGGEASDIEGSVTQDGGGE